MFTSSISEDWKTFCGLKVNINHNLLWLEVELPVILLNYISQSAVETVHAVHFIERLSVITCDPH